MATLILMIVSTMTILFVQATLFYITILKLNNMSTRFEDFVTKIESIRVVLANIREDVTHLKEELEKVLAEAGLPQSETEEVYALLAGLFEKAQSIDEMVPDRDVPVLDDEEEGDEEEDEDDEEEDQD
jgi:hypothetical protein